MPLEIYLQRETDPEAAVALSFLLIAVAVLVVAVTYRVPKSPLRALVTPKGHHPERPQPEATS